MQRLVRSALVALACFAACAPGPSQSPRAPSGHAEAGGQPAPGADGSFHTIVRGYDYACDFGPYSVKVDADDGGRIVAFSFEGRSVIVPRSESPEAFGSSFWPSPQSDWSWPPPAEFDSLPWKASVDGASLVLESEVNAKLGLSARQRLTADAARGALRIELTLTNRGSVSRRVAPWQNTRVRPRGLTFYPSTAPTSPDSAFPLSPREGIIWFAHDPNHKPTGKLFADGSEGWLAHVDGDLMFVKVFPEVPPALQAPKEGEIEIYVPESGRFVEVEQQGAYVELAPGASSTWLLHWLVRRVPAGAVASPGNSELVRFARTLAKSVR